MQQVCSVSELLLPERWAANALPSPEREYASQMVRAMTTLRAEYRTWQYLDDLQWQRTRLPDRLVYLSLFSDAPQWSAYTLTRELARVPAPPRTFSEKELQERHRRARSYFFTCVVTDLLGILAAQQEIRDVEARERFDVLDRFEGSDVMRRWILREAHDVMRNGNPRGGNSRLDHPVVQSLRTKLLWRMFRRGKWRLEGDGRSE